MAKRGSSEPKKQDLPGMEDRAIKPLHDLATQYVGKRDARMQLLEEEVELKGKIRDLMKKHNRTKYAFDGVEVELTPPDGVEKVKVKVAKDHDEAEGEDE